MRPVFKVCDLPLETVPVFRPAGGSALPAGRKRGNSVKRGAPTREGHPMSPPLFGHLAKDNGMAIFGCVHTARPKCKAPAMTVAAR